MANILVIRFSAIGDVAMTVPVIHSLAQQYPQHTITVLSKSTMRPLFANMPKNVQCYTAEVYGKHKGIEGLNKLFNELKDFKFDYVADLHDVLRSKYLTLRFRFTGASVATIDKGRREKRRLVKGNHTDLSMIKTSFARYIEVFKALGLPVQANFTSIYGESKGDLNRIVSITGEKGKQKWVGIAPFAAHEGKIYPIEKMERVVKQLIETHEDVRLFLFGGGKKEKEILERWETKYKRVTSVVGKLKLETEFILMSHLDVMLTMDSANMHLASLVNTSVVSVWGATHPYAGFLGWKQLPTNTVQLDMPCRPCSIYGNKACKKGNYACLKQIPPKMIVKKIERLID